MAKFFVDGLLPVFSAVADVDYGPTTGKPIRYSLATFETILRRFLDEYVPNTATWIGPIIGNTSLILGASTYTSDSTPSSPYDHFNLSAFRTETHATGATSHEVDFIQCPFADGVAPPREDANLTEFGLGEFTAFLQLNSPAIPEADWEHATVVWLPFILTLTGRYVYDYLCSPSGANGTVVGADFNDNFLGIDYAAGGGGFGISPTSSIAIGDGTTKAFFWTPTGDRFLLNTLNTNNY